MTPEERAQRIIVLRWPLPCGDMLGRLAEKDIAAAIREAVAEEREACARIAENAGKVGMGHAEAAVAIRARSKS